MFYFFKDYYWKHFLKLYKKHKFLFIIISRNHHIAKDRAEISSQEVWMARDFAERFWVGPILGDSLDDKAWLKLFNHVCQMVTELAKRQSKITLSIIVYVRKCNLKLSLSLLRCSARRLFKKCTNWTIMHD